MIRRAFQWWALCIGLALLLAIGFVLWYSAPAAHTKDFAYADTTVGLTFSRGDVLFPGECITMRWDVMNTRRVMIGDELMPAAGDTTICIDVTTQPALQVMLMDGSEVTVTQPINILATHSTFVTLAVFALALLVLGLAGLLLSAYRHAGASKSVGAIARIVSVSAISIAVTLLIIEVLLRAFLFAAGSRDQKIMYLYSLAEIRALQNNIMPMPYISYVPDPAYDGHNRLGYRGAGDRHSQTAGIFPHRCPWRLNHL